MLQIQCFQHHPLLSMSFSSIDPVALYWTLLLPRFRCPARGRSRSASNGTPNAEDQGDTEELRDAGLERHRASSAKGPGGGCQRAVSGPRSRTGDGGFGVKGEAGEGFYRLESHVQSPLTWQITFSLAHGHTLASRHFSKNISSPVVAHRSSQSHSPGGKGREIPKGFESWSDYTRRGSAGSTGSARARGWAMGSSPLWSCAAEGQKGVRGSWARRRETGA